MKRIPAGLIVLALLGACSQQEDAPPPKAAEKAPAVKATAAASATPAAAASGGPVGARNVDEETPLYQFDYAYPWAAGMIPKLKAELDGDIDKQRTELAAQGHEERTSAKQAGYEYRKVSRQINWQVVTELPNWLSLSAQNGWYSGGAHPNYVFDSMLWDKQADTKRNALDLFLSKQALDEAIRPAFCREIDRQRAKKRGEDFTSEADDPFNKCYDPSEFTIILGSSNGNTFNRIGVLVPPYGVGPYVEGNYEVTLPVSAALLNAVKPEFRSSFSVGR